MRTYSVTVKMTPRQAVVAMDGLHDQAAQSGNNRLYDAEHRIYVGLLDAGWSWDNRAKTWMSPSGEPRDDL